MPSRHGDAWCLLDELEQAQRQMYEQVDPAHGDPDGFTRPGGRFVVAYVDDEPLGCGGIRTLRPGISEIRKMYVRPSARGLGIASEILNHLEQVAAENGASEIWLETGVHNTAAIALYTSHGYQRAASYVSGRDPRINRAFRKNLTERH